VWDRNEVFQVDASAVTSRLPSKLRVPAVTVAPAVAIALAAQMCVEISVGKE
jgi:hypothetical protein